MTRRDWQLLDKQFAYLRPAPRLGGWHVAMTLAFFVAGLGAVSLVALRDPDMAQAAATHGLPKILASYEASHPKL